MNRTFHRVWIGPAEPPYDFAPSWLDLNPGWTLTTWTDSDLGWIVNRPLFDRAAEFCPPWYVTRLQADIACFEILAEHGGVYLDFDMEALAPLEPHLPGKAWSVWERPGVVNKGICGAPERLDPFWTKMVDGIPDRLDRYKGRPTNESSGPWYVTWMRDRFPDLLEVLPTRMFYPYGYRDLIEGAPPDFDRDGVVAHHLWAGRPEVRS